jgi:hypothetical protein
MFSLQQERQPEWLIVMWQAVKQQHNFCHVYQDDDSTASSVKASEGFYTHEIVLHANTKWFSDVIQF